MKITVLMIPIARAAGKKEGRQLGATQKEGLDTGASPKGIDKLIS